MSAKTTEKRLKKKRIGEKVPDRKVMRARYEFVVGLLAIVYSGEALPYFVEDRVNEAIKSGREALKKRELCPWARKHLNEIVLGLELAKYALAHLDEITTEEDELKALRPHIQEWLEKDGYDSPYRTYPEEEMVDRILEALKGYWDKFDIKAWQRALDWVAIDDEIEAARPCMAEWLKEKGRDSSKKMVDGFLEQLKDYWGKHGILDVFDVSAWEAALDSLECRKDAVGG